MDKKKIFIYSYNLGIGGIERSLIGLLEAIDYSKYSVDLYLLKHEGELMELIPKQVNLLPEDKKSEVFGISIADAYKRGYIYEASVRLYAKIKGALLKKKHPDLGVDYLGNLYHRLILERFPKNEKKYDLALSFYFPHYYTLRNINAKCYVGWIHTDYSKLYLRKKETLPMFMKLDKIAAISKEAGEALISVMPELKEKIIVIENIFSPESIRMQADKKDVFEEMPDDGSVKILSIGRFCKAKNFDNIPEICRRILDLGCNIKWYIIGYGADEDINIVKAKIDEYNVRNNVILLGKKLNPYPYIKACNIYIQPSRYEGKSVTVREAQVLCKPVIITNYSTAKSQLEDGIDGVIVPMDNEGCADKLAEIIKDRMLQNKLINNCQLRDYSNSKEIEKIYHLIGD